MNYNIRYYSVDLNKLFSFYLYFNRMANMKVQGNITARGEEPPMFLQRPSTGKSQDVRHILTRTFRDLYTRDAIGPETVRNLNVSKGGDDPYHERYVESLQKVLCKNCHYFH